MQELRKSLDQSGSFEILICANCAASGYRSCGDLALKPFSVVHKDHYVEWVIESPGHDNTEEGKVFLTFKFHRPQYIAEVKKIESMT